METSSYACPHCGAVSHHPTDKAEGYCGRCHRYARRFGSDEPTDTEGTETTQRESRGLLDHLRFAIADPGAFYNRLPVAADEMESIANWGARAAIVVIHERDRLARTLTCSQCGRYLRKRACGPTHAMLAYDPWQHTSAPKPDWDKVTWRSTS